MAPKYMNAEEAREYHLAASRKTYRKRMDIVTRYRNERGCLECGERHPATLTLHHRDPENKHPRLKASTHGHGGHWGTLNFGDIQAELEKCDVLCANCHAILHANEEMIT